MKKWYQIALHGCDAPTYFELELTEEQLRLVKFMVEISEKASSYQCEPTMEVKEINKEESQI